MSQTGDDCKIGSWVFAQSYSNVGYISFQLSACKLTHRKQEQEMIIGQVTDILQNTESSKSSLVVLKQYFLAKDHDQVFDVPVLLPPSAKWLIRLRYAYA
jgi:hypothetical protein